MRPASTNAGATARRGCTSRASTGAELARVEAGARAFTVVARVGAPGVRVEVDVVLGPLLREGADDAGDEPAGHGCGLLAVGNDTLRIAYYTMNATLRFVCSHHVYE